MDIGDWIWMASEGLLVASEALVREAQAVELALERALEWAPDSEEGGCDAEG